MERPNTISGLNKKRAELSKRIEQLQRELNALIVDLDHVDHTVRLFDPDAEMQAGRLLQFPARHAAFRGEMQRFVLGALRVATEPLTSFEIARGVVQARGLDLNDQKTLTLFRKRVGACLKDLKRKGWVRDVPAIGPHKLWELAR